MRYLSLAEVTELHRLVIEASGGSHSGLCCKERSLPRLLHRPASPPVSSNSVRCLGQQWYT